MIDIASLVSRAEAYATATGRSLGGVSKELFDDVRTLTLIQQGGRNITIARLERALERMARLERAAMERQP